MHKNKEHIEDWNTSVNHPLQAYEWGEFREKTGIKVVRGKDFQITIHKVPHTPWTIGYLPKGPLPTVQMLQELMKIGKENKCIFIQLEPNTTMNQESRIKNQEFMIHNSKFMIPLSAHPLFTKYTLVLDLTKSEEELLRVMHPKTRYNIKVAQKYGVTIKEESSDEAFQDYLQLTKETTNRQGFFAHTQKYHELMWETLKSNDKGLMIKDKNNRLSAHLFVARYKNIPLTAWVLFTFHDTLYYPYGASSSEHRETMASNLMMWEAIQFGKKMGLKKFDMWGSLGPNPDPKDPWFGFHRFKMGYGPKLVEFIGSYDLIINPFLYQLYKLADKLRWVILKTKSNA